MGGPKENRKQRRNLSAFNQMGSHLIDLIMYIHTNMTHNMYTHRVHVNTMFSNCVCVCVAEQHDRNIQERGRGGNEDKARVSALKEKRTEKENRKEVKKVRVIMLCTKAGDDAK